MAEEAAISSTISHQSPGTASTDADEGSRDDDEVHFQASVKKRRLATNDFTRRKRAVTACQFCRMRKTRCDNARPRCTYCVRQRAKCIYEEPDEALVAEEQGDMIISNKQIMDRLDEIKEILQNNSTPLEGELCTINMQRLPQANASSTTQSSLVASPWARFPSNEQHETALPTESGVDQARRLPFATLRTESLLRWPALRTIVPADALDIDSFPLSSGYTESAVLGKGGQAGQGIDEDSFVPLCRKFLALVNPRNPVLDGNELMRLARSVAESGLKWDSASCLVVRPSSICKSLACY